MKILEIQELQKILLTNSHDLFWLLYFCISIIISTLLIKLFDSKILRVLVFSTSFSLMNTIWFRGPGEEFLAPILSIFLLSNQFWKVMAYLELLGHFICSSFHRNCLFFFIEET